MANLNGLGVSLRDERATHGHSTECSFYGIIQQRQHGTARLGQLPLAHTTHSVTQSGLSHLPTHLTYGFGRTHLPNLFGCINPLYEIRSGIHHAYNMYIARRVVNLALIAAAVLPIANPSLLENPRGRFLPLGFRI